jgi:uncharacterized membrane protein YczE
MKAHIPKPQSLVSAMKAICRYSFAVAGLLCSLTGLSVVTIYFTYNMHGKWDVYDEMYVPPSTLAIGLTLLLSGVFTFLRRGVACAMAVIVFGYGARLCIKTAFSPSAYFVDMWWFAVFMLLFGIFICFSLLWQIRDWRWP